MRKEFEKGRCPVCSEDVDVVHTILKCSEMRKWREKHLSREWLFVNEEIAYKKIKDCATAVELKKI